MKKTILKTIVVLGAAMLFTGCATTQLQTKVKTTRTVTLDHSVKEKKVYLQVTNTAGSGGEDMELYKDLKNNLQNKGYDVLGTSKGASYGVFVNVLFANNLREANAIKAASAGLTLGTAGSALGGNDVRGSLLVGATVALGSAVIGKALEDDVFRAVVDVSIRDYQENNVKTLKTTSVGDAQVYNVARSGNMNQLAGALGNKDAAGDMNSGITETVTTETVKNYEEHKTRVFAEAVKMGLKHEEALPVLQHKVSRQIANLF